MKGEKDKSTIIIGDVNVSLSVIDRPIRQIINLDIDDQKNTINKFDRSIAKHNYQKKKPIFLFDF